MKSLDDGILFPRANVSTMLNAQGFHRFKENLIYFTNDRQDKINSNYLYKGHDLSVFNVMDGHMQPTTYSR